jgi:hypothetical protein
MQDLGTIQGDTDSGAIGINDAGDVVGVSGSDAKMRAFFRRNGDGVPADLNCLVVGNPNCLVVGNPSGLYLLLANFINSRGEIIGVAFDSRDNQTHGFLAKPSNGGVGDESAVATIDNLSRPENARTRQLLFGRAGAWLSRPR